MKITKTSDRAAFLKIAERNANKGCNKCPCCGNCDIDYPEHHCICGQTLDWSDINT